VQIAERVHNFAARLHAATGNHQDVVFDTVHIVVKDAEAIHAKGCSKGINFAQVRDTEDSSCI
jgi:glycine cleavage system pyridoxal-binding protein P